jgi:hypothetical protein
MSERILSSLKVGKQSSEYKRAKAVIDRQKAFWFTLDLIAGLYNYELQLP